MCCHVCSGIPLWPAQTTRIHRDNRLTCFSPDVSGIFRSYYQERPIFSSFIALFQWSYAPLNIEMYCLSHFVFSFVLHVAPIFSAKTSLQLFTNCMFLFWVAIAKFRQCHNCRHAFPALFHLRMKLWGYHSDSTLGIVSFAFRKKVYASYSVGNAMDMVARYEDMQINWADFVLVHLSCSAPRRNSWTKMLLTAILADSTERSRCLLSLQRVLLQESEWILWNRLTLLVCHAL